MPFFKDPDGPLVIESDSAPFVTVGLGKYFIGDVEVSSGAYAEALTQGFTNAHLVPGEQKEWASADQKEYDAYRAQLLEQIIAEFPLKKHK